MAIDDDETIVRNTDHLSGIISMIRSWLNINKNVKKKEKKKDKIEQQRNINNNNDRTKEKEEDEDEGEKQVLKVDGTEPKHVYALTKAAAAE